MSREPKAYRSALKAVRELYAKLPALKCQGKCQASCGPIDICVGPVEIKAGGLDVLTAREWLADRGLHCHMLKAGKCSVHEARPLICRMWGLVDHPDMICPWGCKPERYLTQVEGKALLDKLQAIEDRYARETETP